MDTRIAIIGAGNVGGITAMRIVEEGIADCVLVDVAKGLAQAKAFDLDDARSLIGHKSHIEGSEDISKISGSDIVVVTAGLARKPGMTREEPITQPSIPSSQPGARMGAGNLQRPGRLRHRE